MKRKYLALYVSFFMVFGTLQAQDKLYPNEFPLADVTLLEGPFKQARDLNIQTLLKYDVDRLLAPYRKQAGLTEKAKCFLKMGFGNGVSGRRLHLNSST